MIEDNDETIHNLRARLEEVEAERDNLMTAIAEHCESLGWEGNTPRALRETARHVEEKLGSHEKLIGHLWEQFPEFFEWLEEYHAELCDRLGIKRD